MELNPMLTDVEETINPTSTEQTNSEDVNAKEQQGTSDAPEISVAGEEQKKEEESKAEEAKETDTEQPKETKIPQSKEQNSIFARQRREKEEAERLAKAKEEARIQAVIDTLGGINPFTNEKMVDAEDVEEYLLMKKIESDGNDPLEKYPSELKNQKREQEKAEAAKRAEQEAAKKDIEDFMSKYPNVTLQDLEKDEAFNSYVEGKLGKKSLSELYASYLGFRDSITKSQEAAKKEAEILGKAQQNSAVGSATTPTPADDDTYTFEELSKLSASEIDRNWKKVERSKKKLNIYY